MPEALVIGIGGAGCNVLNGMTTEDKAPFSMLAINTDERALEHSPVRYKLLIGASVCRGLGAGRNPKRGKEAAAQSLPDIKRYLDYTDTIILVAGLGGGTGSGAIQVIARYALDLGKQVFCIVSTPFKFEGKDTSSIAQEVLRELDHANIEKIVFDNQDLFARATDGLSFADAFKETDEAIARIIADIIERHAPPSQTGIVIPSDRIKIWGKSGPVSLEEWQREQNES